MQAALVFHIEILSIFILKYSIFHFCILFQERRFLIQKQVQKSDLKPGIEVYFHFALILLGLYQYRALTSKCDCKEISLQLCCSLTVLLDTHPRRYNGEIIK